MSNIQQSLHSVDFFEIIFNVSNQSELWTNQTQQFRRTDDHFSKTTILFQFFVYFDFNFNFRMK